MRARGCAANTVAEVLSKGDIVSLDTGGGRCIAVGQGSVDDVEATLALVQSQLEVGTAAPGIVLVAPLDVKDPVGSSATNRREDPKPGVHRKQVVPVWHDGVVVRGPRQALVSVVGIRGGELGTTVG